jgi:hypothetical protein
MAFQVFQKAHEHARCSRGCPGKREIRAVSTASPASLGCIIKALQRRFPAQAGLGHGQWKAFMAWPALSKKNGTRPLVEIKHKHILYVSIFNAYTSLYINP